jgi:sugar phosphate isomerase/epimerase
VTSLFISFPNQNWADWKNSVGLVPPQTRAQRVARACRSADWARELGVTQIASHVGCVPENPDDPNYLGFIETLRGFCLFLEANGQVLAYETGQESVKTLARMMSDIGVGSQRVNFDPANLLIYDHDDPMELVKTLGDKVVHVHCKDGRRPSEPGKLGSETKLGGGDSNFPELLKKLHGIGYRGPLTIERETAAGPGLDRDITDAIQFIEKLKKELR